MRIDHPPPPPGAASGKAQPGALRGFTALRLAAVLVPLLAVIGGGIVTWNMVQQEAATRMERTVGLLRENALRAFDAQQAILAAITRAMAGRRPSELREDPGFQALLSDLAAAGAPVISGVLVVDGEARIVSASYEFPARPADLSDRDYVRMLADGTARRAIGEPVFSRPMGWPIIPVARRAPAPPGWEEPPGIVVSSFSPVELARFYASVAENPHDVVALFREDGKPLARHPAEYDPADPAIQARVAAMLARLLGAEHGPLWVDSAVDGRRRLFLARRLGDWPAVVAYGLDHAALSAEWRRRMIAPVLAGVAASALLLALTGLAARGAQLQREQAEAEAHLARAGRAASLGLLAAGLAHDIKNLVQSVRSGARVLEHSAGEPADVRRCARLLGDAADRGGQLADAMLAFARGGTDESAPPPRLETRPVLAELSDLLARTLGSGWGVRALLPPDLPPTHGDRAGFEAAIVNLAANARDAMPDGGIVTITAHETVVEDADNPSNLRPGRYVVTAVHDSGTGMDEATLARLGEPFFTTKPAGIGTGLGLATVRGFCARAGGTLRFESAPGQGTTASIWLPVAT